MSDEHVTVSLRFTPEQLEEEADGVLRYDLTVERARRLADALQAAANGMPVVSGDVGVRGQG